MAKKKTFIWWAYGILNAYGDPWSPKTFETIAEAERYMEVFWGDLKNPPDMSKHKVIQLRFKKYPLRKRRPAKIKIP